MERRLGRSIKRERRRALQRGYEQLCEWLNYDDETKHYVQHLLNGEYVAPYFQEYREDYLDAADVPVVEEIGCDGLFGWICDRDAFNQPKYCASLSSKKWNGSKKGWTALDHATRFVVQVLNFSWKNGGEWDHGQFDLPGTRRDDNTADSDESGNEFYQVWAILRYLQAEWEAANIDDWEPDRMYASFTKPEISRL